MARPIPTNQAGLRPERRYVAPGSISARDLPQRSHLGRLDGALTTRSQSIAQCLLLVSGLAGGLAAVSAMGIWPWLSAAELGLDQKGLFCLLVGGTYLVATALYAAWRTQALQALNQAPWDARLMAYVNLLVGGTIIVLLILLILSAVALMMIVVGVASLLGGAATSPAERQ